jgi:holo-[acyl-carrier protein] synthase
LQVGTDIVQISRIEKSLKKFGEHFKKKYLTESEIENIENIESLAGLWAAKEAISKALGCGIGQELTFEDIEISKTAKGAPFFTLSSKVLKHYPVKESSLSISHDGGFAIAIAVVILSTPET